MKQASKALQGQQIGPENEVRVAVTLRSMCQGLLKKLGPASLENSRLAELEALTGADKVQARSEVAALRYREHVRAMLTKNEQLFADMEKIATAEMVGHTRDEV